MIRELRLRDLGVIADATLEPGPGLTAITGETGAGKTMLLTGLGLLLGGRADPATVRPGADRAAVEGVLVPHAAAAAIAEEAGALVEDGELVVVRTVAAEGRSRAHLGGRTVPLAILAELGEQLVTVHGQADQLRLRATAQQRAALDAYAGEAHAGHLRRLAEAHAERARVAAELDRWDTDAAARAAELAGARDTLARIEALEPLPGELEELREEAERLGNVEELRAAALTIRGSLEGDDQGSGVLAALEGARRSTEAVAEHDPQLRDWAARLTDVSAVLGDVLTESGSYASTLEADPQRLEQVHARRAALTDLVRTYGSTADGDPLAVVLGRAEEARTRVGELTDPARGRDGLAARLQDAVDAEREVAAVVTAGRTRAASSLQEAVTAELAALAMKGARVGVRLSPREEIASWGAEDVELELVSHPGAPARPLARSASGGEMSRIMLALEVALAAQRAEDGALPAFVFDEVDAGVGGRAAIEVGRRLAELATHTQVIVVTHLAQVAAFAGTHLVVARAAVDGVEQAAMRTDVRQVAGEERELELARMLSGEDSAAAREHAAELLARSRVRP